MRGAKQQGSVQRFRRAATTVGLVVSLAVGAYLISHVIEAREYVWLGWFSLLPLFLVIRLWHPVGAMSGGLLWGILVRAFLTEEPGGLMSPTVLSLLLALIPAGYTFLGSWLSRRIGFNPFVLAVAWMVVELTFELVELRTGLLDAARESGALLHWTAQVLGCIFIAFLVALMNASLALLLGRTRLRMPAACCVSMSGDLGATHLPKTYLGLPLSGIAPSRPRAPPNPSLCMRDCVAAG